MKILVTAGTVYGKLDDNKLVGNRIRGIWATKFAYWLGERGHDVTLLAPDTMEMKGWPFEWNGDGPGMKGTVTVLRQDGYFSYAEQCYALAPRMDAAVMAAAVVNWIPETPFKGKMPTEGYEEGAIQNIPFLLAPRVIDRMKKLNPKMTLIGCKMTSGAEKSVTLRAAYQTLLKAHCNVVVANDLSQLKLKLLVYPDGNVVGMEDFAALYYDLEAVLNDEHYHTVPAVGLSYTNATDTAQAKLKFNMLCAKYRSRFIKRLDGPSGPDRVFGAVAVRVHGNNWLVSPREKGHMFTAEDAVFVFGVNTSMNSVITAGGAKATLNAPLLLRVMNTFNANSVVHFHDEEPDWEVLPYAPPGTVRDNNRDLPKNSFFNIKGHGCVFTEA